MSLKSFQSEIQDICARELARQRGQASGTLASRNIHSKKTQIVEDSNIVVEASQSRDAGVEDEVEAVLVLYFHQHVVHSLNSSQTLLSIHDYDRARTSVAQLITGRKGEYIFHIGCRPPHASLFAEESVDEATGWSGVPRTDVEVTSLQSSVKRVVEELGGKVCALFIYRQHEFISNRYPFFSKLLTATIHVQLYYYDYLHPALNWFLRSAALLLATLIRASLQHSEF